MAVGGNFFADGCVNKPYPKPWSTKSNQQMLPFWEGRDDWFPTWNAQSDDNAMQVDYIRVYDFDPDAIGNYYWYQEESNYVQSDPYVYEPNKI